MVLLLLRFSLCYIFIFGYEITSKLLIKILRFDKLLQKFLQKFSLEIKLMKVTNDEVFFACYIFIKLKQLNQKLRVVLHYYFPSCHVSI